jgi:hypothetical protein
MPETSEGSRGWFEADTVDLGGGVQGGPHGPWSHPPTRAWLRGSLKVGSGPLRYLYITEQQLVVFTR